LEPFGSNLTFTFLRGHVQLSAGFGGTETWKTDGMLQGLGTQRIGGALLAQSLGGIGALRPMVGVKSPYWGGGHLITNDQFNDQWLVQSHVGVRFFVDKHQNISFGFEKGYMYNQFNPFGSPGWTSSTGDLTIRFGDGPSKYVGRQLRKWFGKR
jgi:hypothetical protein